MRQFKAISCLAISIMILVIICACTPAATSPTTTTPAAQSGFAGKVKIGVIGPMNYMQGKDLWDSATMAAEEINKAGGINVKGSKYEIELVKSDSNDFASVPDAVSAFERLVTMDKCSFVVGGFRSEAVLAMQELLAPNKAILLNPCSSSPDLTKRVKANYDKYKYYFRTGPVNVIMATPPITAAMQVVIDKVKTELGVDKPRVGFIMQKAAYVDAVVDAVQKMVQGLGAEPIGVYRPSATAPTLVAELSALKEANAHIAYIHFDGPAGVNLDKEWGTMKFPFANTGYNSEAQTKQHWAATNNMCEYSVALAWTARSNITPTNVAFWDEYVKRFDRFPSVYCAHPSIYILKEAIERAGTLDTDAVISELEKTDSPTSQQRLKFYPNDHTYPHDTIIDAGYATGYLTQWIKGEPKVVWPDGKPLRLAPNPDAWAAVKYPGTIDYQLPPWVVEYWKGKK